MTERCGRELTRAPKPLRPLLIAVGFLNVALGFVGVFVPLLPTTPFLLLAAVCFIRSSDRFYEWLMTNRWVGDYLRSYMEHRATTMSTKIVCIGTLWCCLGLAGVFFTDSWIVRLLLLVVAVGVTAHLASLKTIRRDAARDARGSDRDAEPSPGASSCGRASRLTG
jgi:uncharacterized membrane protein YbaN (DUF454 family)